MSEPVSQRLQPGAKPGDVLAGKYRVERVLGEGGMGIVVAAHHLQLDEKVALKFLLPRALQSPEAVERFLREARAAAKIKSEHVARVTDVGQLETGAPYMVMEYLEGNDLAAIVANQGALPFDQAVEFVLQACEALAEAHGLGIVHRDLKPANLFCIRRPDGGLSVKVLDFGISKSQGSDAANSRMTKTSAFLGSPVYMSPEQMRSSRDVDARTDIWSLGIILFELLTAKEPFVAETVTELAIKIATEDAPPVTRYRDDCPPVLARVVATCLARDRTQRFQSVGELAVALADLGGPRARISIERILGVQQGGGARGSQISISNARLVQPGGSTAASWGGKTTGENAGLPSSSSKKLVAAVGILVSLLVLGGLAFGVMSLMKPSLPVGLAAEPPSGSSLAPPAPPTAPVPPESAAVPTVPAPPVSLTPAAPAATPRPSKSEPRPAPHAKPAAAAGASPAPSPKTSCDPPYFFDSKGDKRFKPECI